MLQSLLITALAASTVAPLSTAPPNGADGNRTAPPAVREIAARLSEEAAAQLEIRAQLQQCLRAPAQQRTPPHALVLSSMESFTQWMGAALAYDDAYLAYTMQQVVDLVDASDPTFTDGQAARTSVAALLGGGYTLESTWFACVPSGTSYPTLTLSSGQSGTLSNVALFPWSFPQVDLSAQPAFVQTALASANQSTNDAQFYAARSNGSLWHTGIAAPIPISGSSTPLLVLWPDTLVGAERVLAAADFALLRQLDVVLGGLDWTLLQDLIRPAYQPPTWNYSPSSDGALHDGCCAHAWECLVAASHRFRNAQLAADAAYQAELDAARADYESDLAVIRGAQARMMRLFAQAGYQGSLGGATYGAWMTSFHQYMAQNKAQYDAECQSAMQRRRDAECAALKQAKADVWDCTKNCPDYDAARKAFDELADLKLAENGC
ncbi:MAG: hypothetical protein EPO68_11195 [Planctomycetota bacterium]|nr:MAG: hypothetical protein EPO68_11195 [Planctomycetota bacterium]